MTCAERSSLWAYAAGELAAEAREELDKHLGACEGCRQELDAVRATREVLTLAAPAAPEVDWRQADEQIHGAVEKKLARLERGWFNWSLAFALGAGAVAVVVALTAVGHRSQKPAFDPSELAYVKPIENPSAVESADGVLATLGADEHLLKPGDELKTGTALRTTVSGKAIFKLPEGSKVRVASATDLVVERAAGDEVGLLLRKGRVAVKATHAARKEFTVQAGGATVKVVGTVFSVGMSDSDIDVAVTEGRVIVDFPDGKPAVISAGERQVFDRAKGELHAGSLTPADKAEVKELGVEAEVAVAQVKRPRPVRLANPVVPGPVPAPVPAAISTTPEIPIEPPVRIEPVDKPSDTPASVAAPAVPKPETPLHSITSEEHFLHMADEALKRGACARYLPMLTEYLEDPEQENVGGREDARILKARCLLSLHRTVEADAQYRKYLDEFARGRFAAEARGAVAH